MSAYVEVEKAIDAGFRKMRDEMPTPALVAGLAKRGRGHADALAWVDANVRPDWSFDWESLRPSEAPPKAFPDLEKRCPECDRDNYMSHKYCPDCGCELEIVPYDPRDFDDDVRSREKAETADYIHDCKVWVGLKVAA